MKNLRILVAIVVLVLVGRSGRASASTLTALHGFTGGPDGARPLAGLVQGSDSNFYGTTSAGGVNATGTVFKISSAGTFTALHGFTGGADGAQPFAGLVEGTDSNFYGTTSSGGVNESGTVFKISSAGTFTTLHPFTGGTEGAQPSAGLVQGSDSNFYGTTFSGGVNGSGTVFKVSPAGLLTTLHAFTGGGDGGQPLAGLVQGSDSNFYGTTFSGGNSGLGAVFKISPAGTLTALWNFGGSDDGGQPFAGLVQGSDGKFYGTTASGGGSGLGAVFKISSAGALTALWNFTGGDDGGQPLAGLVEGDDGNFYGTTFSGGKNGFGTVFKISSAGALATLWNFAGGADGANPRAGLIAGSVSNFYGTTAAGGSSQSGTVFALVQPCTYILSPTRVTVPAIALSNTFTVTAGSTNCPWTAASNVSWLTITSDTNGVGNGTVAYSVAANTNATVHSRVGKITVAGKTFTVTQQPLVFGKFLQGTYDGLVLQTNAPSQASSGFIKIVFSKTGSFAAKLTVGGVRSSFKGKFDEPGNATNLVLRKNLDSLQVILHLLDVTNGTEQVTGTVSNNVFTSDLLADLAVFSRVNPSPFVGLNTFVLAPADSSDPTVPQGYGYGTLAVTATGSGHMRGVLGDGTKISATVPISGDGTWPLYNSLYKNQGSCIGWVTTDTNNTLGATVDWFRPAILKAHLYPAGFTTTTTLTGAIYVSPTAGGPSVAGSGTLTLGGGNLPSNIVKNVIIDAHGKVTVTPSDSDKLALKIQPTTGRFSGRFLNPAIGRKTIKFNGLLLQTDNSGAGFFVGTNHTGFVTVEPVP